VALLRGLGSRFFSGHGSGLGRIRDDGVRFRMDIADLDYPPTYLDRVRKLESDADCLSAVRTRLQCAGRYFSAFRVDV